MEKKNQIFFKFIFFPLPAAAAPLYGGIDGILGVFAPAGNEFFEEDNPSCAWEKWRKKSDFFLLFLIFFSFFQLHFMGE